MIPICPAPGSSSCAILSLLCLLSGMVVFPVLAADAAIEAELGDTLNLHGVSYTGNSVYLFLTGPGLAENGVTLSDVTQRADQGKFTRVDLDSDQKWSMRWNTARIENEINPGTYIVYVTNEPVDKSHLGGPDSYKTLEVYFTESMTQRVAGNSGTSYTLNPEMHSSVQAPTVALTFPPLTTAVLLTPPPTPLPPPATQAPLHPVTVLPAVLFGTGTLFLKKE